MFDYLKFWMREFAWDISDSVEWLEDLQPYYELQETTDFYDSKKFLKGDLLNISTMRSPLSGETLALINDKNCKSVLDIGCGAGAFYHLLNHFCPHVEYFGIDASKSQINKACENFGDLFEQRDASTLSSSELSSYDAVHMYSVLAFMNTKKQLQLIDKILGSNAWTIIELAATKPNINYFPRNCFQHFGKIRVEGKELLTATFFPLLNNIQKIVKQYSNKYELIIEEKEVNCIRTLNISNKDGSALAPLNFKKLQRFSYFKHSNKYVKRLVVKIKPKGWNLPTDVLDLKNIN